jgi:phosphoribosylamine--glycine ligase
VNIVVHSFQGDGVPLALRLQDEGHQVGLFARDPKYRPLAEGLIAHVDDFELAADKADLIVFDMVGHGTLADQLRSRGKRVIGASKIQDLLELDRVRGMELVMAAGCAVPETFSFDAGDFAGAIAFVEENPDRYVFKANANIGSDKTHVAADPDEMIGYLRHLDETIDKEEHRRPPFILQAVVEGTEISTERWYAAGRPMSALDNSTFELKKFLTGDGTSAGLGPTVGCAGNVVIPHHDRALLAQTVACLDRIAAQHRISGPLDLNAIVDAETKIPMILEVTARFGYDAIQTFSSLWSLPMGASFHMMTEGRDPAIHLIGPIAAGVRVTLPPYPHEDCSSLHGTPILDALLDHEEIWPADIALTPDEQLVAAGVDGLLAVVTGTGRTVSSACDSVYATLAGWRTSELQYRTDLDTVVRSRLRNVQRAGYLMGVA